MRVGKSSDGLEHQLELAQFYGCLRSKHANLLLLALGDQGELIALTLAFIARRLGVLDRALYVDFRFDKFGLLICGRLCLFRINALFLGSALLDERARQLCRKLLAADRYK